MLSEVIFVKIFKGKKQIIFSGLGLGFLTFRDFEQRNNNPFPL